MPSLELEEKALVATAILVTVLVAAVESAVAWMDLSWAHGNEIQCKSQHVGMQNTSGCDRCRDIPCYTLPDAPPWPRSMDRA